MDTSPTPFRGSTRKKREYRQQAFQAYLGEPHSYSFLFPLLFLILFSFLFPLAQSMLHPIICGHSCLQRHVDCRQTMACLVSLSVSLSLIPQHHSSTVPFQPNTFQGVGLFTGPPTPRCTPPCHLSRRPGQEGWGQCTFRQHLGHTRCTWHHNQAPPFPPPTGASPSLQCFWDPPPEPSDSISRLKDPLELSSWARCDGGEGSGREGLCLWCPRHC